MSGKGLFGDLFDFNGDGKFECLFCDGKGICRHDHSICSDGCSHCEGTGRMGKCSLCDGSGSREAYFCVNSYGKKEFLYYASK